jgi:hypothetical protein
MAKKMKLDTTKFKQFVVGKGEKVALGVALALMVVFVGYGLMVGLGASSPAAQIKQEAQGLDQRIKTAQVKTFDKEESALRGWTREADFDKYASVGSWFDGGAAGDTRRQNPTVLPVGDVVAAGQPVKNLTRAYVHGGVLMLDRVKDEINTVKAGGGGATTLPGVAVQRSGAPTGDENFAHDLHPTRMIVVTATFPYLDQLEVIRKALRMSNRDELLKAPEGPPRFLGLIVYRVEGKNPEPKAIYEIDDKGHVVAMLPETKKLMTTAEYDDAASKGVAEYSVPGLVTPLPKFMNGPGYPKLALEGIQVKEGDTGATPMAVPPPGKGGPGGRPPLPGGRAPALLQGIGGRGMAGNNDDGPTMTLDRPISITKIREKSPDLANKLEGNANFLDPRVPGWPEEVEDPAKKLPDFVIPKLMTPAKAKTQDAGEKIAEKILVRFFDADVQPGKTYQYSIQVRMANPNFGKKGLVAFDSLAEVKDLFSTPVYTEPITIPTEYFVYAFDLPGKQIDRDSKVKGSKGTEIDAATTEKTAIQIHEWAGSAREGAEDYKVADWIIAERLLFPRGEKLERKAVEVELPKWNKFKGTQGEFDLAAPGGTSRGKQVGKSRQFATVDFEPRESPGAGVLVDFFGGRRPNEDTSTELLILQPDGRLVVRSSREDTDKGTEAGRVRDERFEEWRARIKGLRPTKDNQKTPGPP